MLGFSYAVNNILLLTCQSKPDKNDDNASETNLENLTTVTKYAIKQSYRLVIGIIFAVLAILNFIDWKRSERSVRAN